MSKFFYNISLPLAVQGTFTYSSDIRLEIGFRVLVDFSNRERIGVVIKKVDKPAFKTLKIKKIFFPFVFKSEFPFSNLSILILSSG